MDLDIRWIPRNDGSQGATAMNSGLPKDVVGRILATIARESRVEGVVLYGSRAKGTYRDGSDIDLAVRDSIDNTDLLSHIERVGKILYKRGAA
jgi:predicted nucleotidyltransferase